MPAVLDNVVRNLVLYLRWLPVGGAHRSAACPIPYGFIPGLKWKCPGCGLRWHTTTGEQAALERASSYEVYEALKRKRIVWLIDRV